MPRRDDLPWDPGLSAAGPLPSAVEAEKRTQVVDVVSRVVEFVELGSGDLEHHVRLLRSLIQRDKQRNLLDYHSAAGALAATSSAAVAAELRQRRKTCAGRGTC